MNKIYQIFKEYKYKLLLIYFFMLVTELSIISQPFLLGKSIDGLISGGWFWIALLFLSYSISNLFNYKRMVYDTKVYTQIYNDIVLRFLKTNNKPDKEVLSFKTKDYDDENGYIGEHYEVRCLLSVPDTNIPINNMLGEQEKICLVDKQEFNKWVKGESSVKWI